MACFRLLHDDDDDGRLHLPLLLLLLRPKNIYQLPNKLLQFRKQLGLCEFIFLLFEYDVSYRVLERSTDNGGMS